MSGATSLVQLILKKWGDDAAGAAKELERLGGFPEPVAQRIASGELPMDEASRVARREARYVDELYYHGTEENIREFAPSGGGELGGGVYVTRDPTQASEYARREYGGLFESGANVIPVISKPLKSIQRDGWVSTRGENMDRLRSENNGDWDPKFLRDAEKEIAEDVSSEGYAGIYTENPIGERSLMYDQGVIYEPSNIRSPNAAFDPQYKGNNIMGGAAGTAGLAGLLAAGQSEDADAGFVTKGGKTLLEAWHGSPHKFDEFSMDQIGTGEGAQAYGHGLYFADEIDVAKGYQPRDRANEEWMYEQYKSAEENGDQYMMDAWERAMMHDSPMELRASAADPDYDEYSQAAFAEVADALSANPGAGSLTRAEIDVTPESLLDWDKPLSEQSEAVRNAVQDIAANGDARFTDQQLSKLNESLLSTEPSNSRGQSIVGILGDDYSVDPRSVDSAYSAAARSFKEYDYPYETALEDIKGAYPDAKPEELEWALKKEYGIGGRAGASSALSDRGIKGIKYLDGDSRAVGDGTSNYVIFDDSLINIAERGNADPRLLAGTAAGTAGLLAAPMLADKDKPLPVPTWGDIGESVTSIIGMPMTGLQGIARGGYGLLTGEDFTEAAAQAGNTMDVGWRDGLLDMSGMNPDKGADQAEAYVTEKTGDESLGWLAKMGLLFGGI